MTAISILGTGRIGRVHAQAVRDAGAELISVYDPIAESAQEVADLHGVEAAASIEEILADPRVQGVVIATPTNTHVDLLSAAVAAGKAVLCEKPIDLDMARVLECEPAVKASDKPILIGFNRRFDPSFRALRERMLAGEIGKPESVMIISRDPSAPPRSYVEVSGGLFRDMTIHDFDMARYLLGDIETVQANGAALVDPDLEGIDIDSAMITLTAKNGAFCVISNSRRCTFGYDQRIEAFGSEGMLQADNLKPTTVSLANGKNTGSQDTLLDFFLERYMDAYKAEIAHFADCIEGRAEPMVTFEDGKQALALADAANESLNNGGAPVKL